MRLAFSKFVYAGREMDFCLMLEAIADMGMKLNRFDPVEDMSEWQDMVDFAGTLDII
jgi:hypothetical protein